jgi:hypothetical protein
MANHCKARNIPAIISPQHTPEYADCFFDLSDHLNLRKLSMLLFNISVKGSN